jgi:hypothetical protein
MKSLAFTTMLAAICLLTSCSKTSNSPDIAQPATSFAQFDYNGDSVYLTNMNIDTTRSSGANNSYFMIAGDAVRTSSNDHCMFNLNMSFVGVPVTDYFGAYAPQVIFSDVTTNSVYSNSFSGNTTINMDIIHNDGKTVSGTFSGTLTLANTDSLVTITNGSFSVTL